MRIDHLSLTNFRNYGRLEVNFPPGATLLHGANAQGKTNLLEAIYYLATTRSPYAEQDQQLLNWDVEQGEEPLVVGRLVAQVTAGGDEQRLIEIRLIKEEQRRQVSFRREALIDRRKVRLMDLLGNLRVVLFMPQDVALVNGPPAGRRRYLDITLCQVDPVYCRTLSAYNKVLEQRNALLRQPVFDRDVLPIYTDKLVKLGSQIFARRARFLSDLAQEAQRIHYEELTDGRETLRLSYAPRLENGELINRGDDTAQPAASLADWIQQADPAGLMSRFSQSLTHTQEADLARGATSMGPHRDDWRFWVNGRDLGNYGSRGQQRSAVLALKLAEIKWMVAETGDTPILLLDEVLAEFDEHRRALLLAYVQHAGQALLTATDPNMFTTEFLRQAATMTVRNGRIEADEPTGGVL